MYKLAYAECTFYNQVPLHGIAIDAIEYDELHPRTAPTLVESAEQS